MIEVQVFKDPDLFFCFRDPLIALEEVFLSDPQMYQDLSFNFGPSINNNTRVFSGLGQGEWIEQVIQQLRDENFPKDVKILLIIIGSDEAHTARWSTQSVHPIYMWLGNSSQAIQNSEKGRILLGFFPLLQSRTIKQKDLAYYRTWILHTCLNILLDSIKTGSQIGMFSLLSLFILIGCWLRTFQSKEFFIPLLATYLGDGPELKKLTLCKTICRICGTSSNTKFI
jgi:hypothetical protein